MNGKGNLSDWCVGTTVLGIMVTAFHVRWHAVEERIASHPEEARQLDEQGRTVLFKALSRKSNDYPPAKIVRKLIQTQPAALYEGVVDLCSKTNTENELEQGRHRHHHHKDKSCYSHLIIAASQMAHLEIIQALVQGRPSVPSIDIEALVLMWNAYRERKFGGSEDDLVDFLMGHGDAVQSHYDKFYCLLEYCTRPGKRYRPWPMGGSILHRAAAVPECSTKLCVVILDLFPDFIQQPDKLGRLPLHCLFLDFSNLGKKVGRWNQHLKLDRLTLLLERGPEAVRYRDVSGALPLHAAIASGWEYPSLRQLIEAFPHSVCELDESSKLYPFELAATGNSSLTTIFILLVKAAALLERRISYFQFARFEVLVSAKPRENTAVLPTTNFSSSSDGYLTTAQSKVESEIPDDDRKVLQHSKDKDAIPEELKRLLRHVKTQSEQNVSLWNELQELLRFEPEMKDNKEWLELHAAVALRECPIGLIRVLIQRHSQQLRQQDERMGRTPLHYAAANSGKSLLATTPPPPLNRHPRAHVTADESTNVVENTNDNIRNNIDPWNVTSAINTSLLDNQNGGDKLHESDLRILRLHIILSASPAAVHLADHRGRLPIHVAIAHGMPLECLKFLVDAWPESLAQKDGYTKLYPFLLAACSPAMTLNNVFVILLRAPHVLTAAAAM